VCRPVAPFLRVTGARRGAADVGALVVRGAGRIRAGAGLGHVALAGGGTALRAGRNEGVGRAGRIRAGAGLGHVALAGRGAALRAGRDEGVGRAVVGDAVAAVRHVAVARRRAAYAGALLIGGARGVGAGAELRDVARAGRGPALGGRRLEGVRRAGSARARAELGLIAGTCRGPALHAGGLERVGRAVVGDAVAALGDVAGAGRGAAHRRGRFDLARRRAAVAVVQVAVVTLFPRIEVAVAAAGAGDRSVDDGRDGLGEMRQVGDAAFRAAHLRDDARVAVEERRVGQGVPARRRIAGRRPERTENAVHLGALHAGRHQVVVVEVLQPAADAVVALAGRGARSRRLLAGVAE